MKIECGDRFGRIVALQYMGLTPDKKNHLWLCRCDCGMLKSCRSGNLSNGHIKSCGCLRREFSKTSNTTHGESGSKSGSITLEYRSWSAMIGRCLNTKNKSYANYSGRGITVCDEWRNSYAAFLRDVGRKPTAKHSIERIKNNLGYFPGNTRWATPSEQARNRRSNHLLTINGKTKPLIKWVEQSKIRFGTIHARINKLGWSAEKAVFYPVLKSHSKGKEIKNGKETTSAETSRNSK